MSSSQERLCSGCGLGGGAAPLTSLVRLQLSLQVFGGHVKVLILSVSGSRFTPTAAAVTAAAQAAAEVAAGGQAADDKQGLQEGRCTHQHAEEAPPPPPRPCGAATLPGTGRLSYLRPPAGQDEVGVDVLFSELLGHVQPQRAVFVVDVPFGGVIQDGVSVVDLLELVRRLGIVGILVRVELQRQFPEE